MVAVQDRPESALTCILLSITRFLVLRKVSRTEQQTRIAGSCCVPAACTGKEAALNHRYSLGISYHRLFCVLCPFALLLLSQLRQSLLLCPPQRKFLLQLAHRALPSPQNIGATHSSKSQLFHSENPKPHINDRSLIRLISTHRTTQSTTDAFHLVTFISRS